MITFHVCLTNEEASKRAEVLRASGYNIQIACMKKTGRPTTYHVRGEVHAIRPPRPKKAVLKDQPSTNDLIEIEKSS